MSIKSIVAFLSALLLGLGLWWSGTALYQAGYDARDAIALRERATKAETTVAQATTNVRESRAEDLQLQAQLKTQLAAATARASQLDRALKKQERTPFIATTNPTPDHAETKPLLGQSVLDVFTLCLLDAERQGVARPGTACAPGRTDAQVDAAAFAPTEVGGGDLARADLDTVRLYRELALRHDGLVDWIDSHLINNSQPD
jgi:hypothetical protein